MREEKESLIRGTSRQSVLKGNGSSAVVLLPDTLRVGLQVNTDKEALIQHTVRHSASHRHSARIDAMQYNTEWKIRKGTGLYQTGQKNRMQGNTLQCNSTVQCSATQYSTAQHSTTHYRAVQHRTVQYLLAACRYPRQC